jgi:nanoRNase/pAp phosphatase (c-di-AMP/oligoRNAs hydrolase)
MKRKILNIVGEQTYQVGVVFSDNYHSELGNVLASENPDLDFIILINGGNRLSFRGVEKGIDLGKVAADFKRFGVASTGGGHPLAAGAELTLEVQDEMIERIFFRLL